MILQGLPPATQSLGIDLVTIEPAAITLCAPIVTPLRIIQRAPISTSSSIIIGALLAVRPSSLHLSYGEFYNSYYEHQYLIKYNRHLYLHYFLS